MPKLLRSQHYFVQTVLCASTAWCQQATKAAAGKITEAVTVALNKSVQPLKAKIQAQADKAITAAKKGLSTLKTSLAKIPAAIKSGVGKVCQALPAVGGVDLKTICSDGVLGIVKNATGMVGKMCESGVNGMIGIANKSLLKASSAAEGGINKMKGACAKAGTGLPDPLGPSIQGACTNVTTTLSKMPAEVLGNTTTKLKDAAMPVCKSLSVSAKAQARSILALSSMSSAATKDVTQLQADAAGMDFTKVLTDAVAQAKGELKKIMDQAVKAAAGKITEAVTAALQKSVVPLQAKIQAQADKAITAATSGLGSLKTSLAKIPAAIKSGVGKVCQALPAVGGVDLKTICSDGVLGIVKNATGMVGKMCESGVNGMIGLANKTLLSVTSAAEGGINKMAGACKTAGTGLPDPLGPSIQGACTNVTSTLSKMPTAIIGNSTVKIKDAASSVCKALSGSAAMAQGQTILLESEHTTHSEDVERQRMVVLEHKRNLRLQSLLVRRVTQLLDVSTVQKAVTDALGNAKAIFTKAVTEAVSGAVSALTNAVNQTMASLKVGLQTEADKAMSVATSGLKTLKNTLAQIPTKVQSLLATLCKPLPAEIAKNCTAGTANIVKNTTGVVAEICKAGVTAMMRAANATCKTAAQAAKGLISKAAGLCGTLTGALPEGLAKPAGGACSNATAAAANIPDAVCSAALGTAQKAANSVCTAISGAGSGSGSGSGAAATVGSDLTTVLSATWPTDVDGTTALSAVGRSLALATRTQSLLAAPTLPAIDFNSIITPILAQAKTLVADAVKQAAAKMTDELKTVMNGAVESAKKAVTTQVEAAVTKAKPHVVDALTKACAGGKAAFQKCIDLTKKVPAMGQSMAQGACKKAAEKVVDVAKQGCNKAADESIKQVGTACESAAAKIAKPIQDGLASACNSLPPPVKDICANATSTVAGQVKDIGSQACTIVKTKAAPLKAECNKVSVDNVTAGVVIPKAPSAADAAGNMAKGAAKGAMGAAKGLLGGSGSGGAMGKAKGLMGGFTGGGGKCPPCNCGSGSGAAAAPAGGMAGALGKAKKLGRRLLSDVSSDHIESGLETELARHRTGESLLGMPKMPAGLGGGGGSNCPPCKCGSGSGAAGDP